MKITRRQLKRLISEAIIKEFRDTNNLFSGIGDINLGGSSLPPDNIDNSGGGGGGDGDEPEWRGPRSFWIFKLNPDQSPSNERIYISEYIFKKIMIIYYKLDKKIEAFNEEVARRQSIGQRMTARERSDMQLTEREIIKDLWHINKELGGHLIAIDSPVGWFGQKYQIHIHAADPVHNDTMQLYTVEILSGALSEHDFEEYRKTL